MRNRLIVFYISISCLFSLHAQVLRDTFLTKTDTVPATSKNTSLPLFGSWNSQADSTFRKLLLPTSALDSLSNRQAIDSLNQLSTLPDSILQQTAVETNSIVNAMISLVLDSIQVEDTVPIVADTLETEPSVFLPLWDISIRSLPKSDRLRSAYEASLIVNNKTHFNRYRIINWDYYNDTINPYILEIVPYFDRQAYGYLPKSSPSLYTTNWFTGDTTQNNDIINQTSALQVFMASRENLIKENPELVTRRWDDLPDPPLQSGHMYLSNISDLKLNYVITDKNMISVPEKLSKKLILANPWRLRGNTALHLNQSSVTEWENGGEGFFSLLGIVTMDADYNRKNFKWENYGEFRLGAIQQEGEPMRKNEDRLRITSNMGVKATKKSKWYYSLNLDFNTQLFNGYNKSDKKEEFPESGFLAPARFYLSAGMDFKEKKTLSVFLSPLTYKLTYMRDTAKYNAQKYGIPDDANKKEEMGGYIRAEANYPLAKQVHLRSRLYFFTDYMEFMRNIDLDWENIINFQINHLLSARISFHFKYDDDVKFKIGTTTNEDGEEVPKYGPKLQFKELLSIGFNYRF